MGKMLPLFSIGARSRAPGRRKRCLRGLHRKVIMVCRAPGRRKRPRSARPGAGGDTAFEPPGRRKRPRPASTPRPPLREGLIITQKLTRRNQKQKLRGKENTKRKEAKRWRPGPNKKSDTLNLAIDD